MNFELILLLGGIASTLSLLSTGFLFIQHYQNWTNPRQQTYILTIALLAPVFAVDSFVGLLELEKGEIVAHCLDAIKELYEAVVINAFLGFMYDAVGLGDKTDKLPEGMKGRHLHIPFPLGAYYKNAHLDVVWLQRLRMWTAQFIFTRPLISIADLLLVDIFPSDFSRPISYLIAVILNTSMTTAVCALIAFYHAFEVELAPRRPLVKFICIKGVVFFATWQGVVLKVLAHLGVLHEGHQFSMDEVELAWQDLLVCIEMGVLFGPLFLYAYSGSEYKRKGVEKGKKID